MDEILAQLRKDIEALHQRLNTLEQTRPTEQKAVQVVMKLPDEVLEQLKGFSDRLTALENQDLQDSAARAELLSLSQRLDEFGPLDTRLRALEAKGVD